MPAENENKRTQTVDHTNLFCGYCFWQLPFNVDIIKHQREISGKSTAAHAAVLAPDHVKIYIYPDIPQYDSDKQVGCHKLMFCFKLVYSKSYQFCIDPSSR